MGQKNNNNNNNNNDNKKEDENLNKIKEKLVKDKDYFNKLSKNEGKKYLFSGEEIGLTEIFKIIENTNTPLFEFIKDQKYIIYYCDKEEVFRTNNKLNRYGKNYNDCFRFDVKIDYYRLINICYYKKTNINDLNDTKRFIGIHYNIASYLLNEKTMFMRKYMKSRWIGFPKMFDNKSIYMYNHEKLTNEISEDIEMENYLQNHDDVKRQLKINNLMSKKIIGVETFLGIKEHKNKYVRSSTFSMQATPFEKWIYDYLNNYVIIFKERCMKELHKKLNTHTMINLNSIDHLDSYDFNLDVKISQNYSNRMAICKMNMAQLDPNIHDLNVFEYPFDDKFTLTLIKFYRFKNLIKITIDECEYNCDIYEFKNIDFRNKNRKIPIIPSTVGKSIGRNYYEILNKIQDHICETLDN